MSIVGNIQFKDSYYDQNYITRGEDSVVIACISKATSIPLHNPPRRRSPSLRADTSSTVISLTLRNSSHWPNYATGC